MRENTEPETAATSADAVRDAMPTDAAAAMPTGAVEAEAEAEAEADDAAQEQEREQEQEQEDPAGGITLSGRSRAGARARVLTGVMLTAGLVAAVGGPDTVSSMRFSSFW